MNPTGKLKATLHVPNRTAAGVIATVNAVPRIPSSSADIQVQEDASNVS